MSLRHTLVIIQHGRLSWTAEPEAILTIIDDDHRVVETAVVAWIEPGQHAEAEHVHEGGAVQGSRQIVMV